MVPPPTQKGRDCIIKAINQKYGIELPKTVKHSLEIDRETNTTFWIDAIWKEMKTMQKAFEILDNHAPNLIGYTTIDFHMIFGIKADFMRKANFVTSGQQTDPPASIAYASVVSRESIRMTFVLAALNDLDIMTANVSGAYLNAPCKEKIMITCGPEFGAENKGKRAKVVRVAYGLKSSGYAWRTQLARVLRDELGYIMGLCRADNDVWFWPT